MPTITLNKEVFEKLVGKKLPLNQLKDRISMLGTDLEGIEGNEIQVEIFPNRPDLLSEQGFARAFSSFIGEKTGLRKYDVKKSGWKVIVDKSVSMRPYTACAIVRNLNLNDEKIKEIMQMQEKLATTHGRNRKKSAYGVYPLHSMTFPITYIAKDPAKVMFQPLGFGKKIPAIQVEEIHPKGKEYKHVAEGWKEYPFFIDDKGEVLCMLPYTNSEDTGKIEIDTEEVFIECTGNDLDNVQVALNMFAAMFSEMGGEIYSLEIEYPDKTITTPDMNPKKMNLDLSYINKRLGLNLNKDEATKLLGRMGYGYEKGKALVPAYRADILHQVDLAEDIAIAYGYENFEEEIPKVATIGEEDPFEKLLKKVREILIGFGLLEAKNYHLMTLNEINEKMGATSAKGIIPLKNAVGDQNHLRNSVLPSLMKNLNENQHNEYPQKIFEIGRVFTYAKKTETGVEERDKLGIVICHEKTDFTEIKQILDALLTALGVKASVQESSNRSFIDGRVGKVVVGDEKLGIIGEISPTVLNNWDIIIPVVCMEIDMMKVCEVVDSPIPERSIKSPKDEETNKEENQEKKPAIKEERTTKKQKTSEEFERIDTERLFYQDPYMKEAEAQVQEINSKEIILNQTIFFAFSGGQESDSGTINGINIVDVKKENHKIIHVLEKEPDFKEGDIVKLELDWERRYQLMKLHSAAHLMYFPFVENFGKVKIIGSNISESKARVDFLYDKPITDQLTKIEESVNKSISESMEITAKPDKKDSEKRWWKCHGWKMPCGGTHVKNTSEIGIVKLIKKNIGKGKERVEIYVE